MVLSRIRRMMSALDSSSRTFSSTGRAPSTEDIRWAMRRCRLAFSSSARSAVPGKTAASGSCTTANPPLRWMVLSPSAPSSWVPESTTPMTRPPWACDAGGRQATGLVEDARQQPRPVGAAVDHDQDRCRQVHRELGDEGSQRLEGARGASNDHDVVPRHGTPSSWLATRSVRQGASREEWPAGGGNGPPGGGSDSGPM